MYDTRENVGNNLVSPRENRAGSTVKNSMREYLALRLPKYSNFQADSASLNRERSAFLFHRAPWQHAYQG